MHEMSLGSLAADHGLVGGPFGSDLVSADYVDDGVPVIRGNNMAGRMLHGDFVFVTEAKFEKHLSRNSAEPGDLIFTQRGTLGQVSLVPDGPYRRYVVSQSQMRLRVDASRADARFLYYACRSPRFLRQVGDSAISTGVPHINLGILGRLQVPCQSLGVQRAVAQLLGALDDKIAANERVRFCAWQLARASFTRDLGSVQIVEHLSLGELSVRGRLILSDGYRTKASEHGRPGLRILRAGDVRPDRIDADGENFVSADHIKAIGAKASMANDIVVTTKGTVGRVAVVPEGQEQVVYSPQLCFFRVADEEKLSSGFLAGWFRSSDFAAQAEMRMYKSDMAPYINLRDVQSIVVPIPREIADQRRIGDTQRSLERLAHSADRENERLAATRDELLPLLMSGKLRVKDAEKVVDEAL